MYDRAGVLCLFKNVQIYSNLASQQIQEMQYSNVFDCLQLTMLEDWTDKGSLARDDFKSYYYDESNNQPNFKRLFPSPDTNAPLNTNLQQAIIVFPADNTNPSYEDQFMIMQCRGRFLITDNHLRIGDVVEVCGGRGIVGGGLESSIGDNEIYLYNWTGLVHYQASTPADNTGTNIISSNRMIAFSGYIIPRGRSRRQAIEGDQFGQTRNIFGQQGDDTPSHISVVEASTDAFHAYTGIYDWFTRPNNIVAAWEISRSSLTATTITCTYEITWKFNMSFFDILYPLMLSKGGIQFKIDLEDPRKVFHTNNIPNWSQPDTTASITYEIQYPRLMGMMVRPADDVIDEYVAQFESFTGILYNLPSVKTRRMSGNSSDTSITLQSHIGVRSAKQMYLVIMDSNIHEGSGVVGRDSRSLSTYLWDNVYSFQAKIGSQEFPLRPVSLKTPSGAVMNMIEWQRQVESVIGKENGMGWTESSWPGQFLTGDKGATLREPSLIMAFDLARDNGDFSGLTGVDLSLVPVDIELLRDNSHASRYNQPARHGDGYYVGGAQGAPVFYLFVLYDAYLRLGSDSIQVLN